jgi:hypothetical protein
MFTKQFIKIASIYHMARGECWDAVCHVKTPSIPGRDIYDCNQLLRGILDST